MSFLKYSVLFVFLSVSCSRSPDENKHYLLEGAYSRAKASLFVEAYVDVDVIWLLQNLLEVSSDQEVEEFVRKKVSQVDRFHPYRLLVDGSAPKQPLPEGSPAGIDRYFLYIQSPFGFPEKRSLDLIEEYLGREEGGYILTHQLAVLVWAEQVGLKLPDSVLGRKRNILEKIYQEQIADSEGACIDLYAERAALLVRYYNPPKEEAKRWINYLMDMQGEDGRWPVSETVLYFDGQYATAKMPPAHTTALAMLAMRAYMYKFGN